MLFKDAGIVVPQEFQIVVSRCLSKNPQKRHKNFKELLFEFNKIYETLTGRLPPAPPIPIPLTINEMVLRAISFAETGLADESIVLYEKIISEEPEVAYHRFNLGRIYQNYGNHDLAIKSYRETVSLDPKLASGWYNLGACLLCKEHTTEGKEALEKAEKLGHIKAKELLEQFEDSQKEPGQLTVGFGWYQWGGHESDEESEN